LKCEQQLAVVISPPPMAQIQRDYRAIILQYRFCDGMEFDEIASRLHGVTATAAQKFCSRTLQRTNSTNIDALLAHKDPLPRHGHPRRVEPGSEASVRIREATRGQYKFQKQVDAANNAFERVRKKHTTT
jgi:hypothetical protein